MQKLFFASVLLLPLWAFAYVSPGSPTGYVNDFANVLSTQTTQSLEQKLVQFQKETSNEVVVVTVPTLGEDYIEHYSIRLAEEWGVGGKKKDNGIILLLATEDRKLRIEVGYGLEGALPDSVASSIIREMVPSLKDANYDASIQTGVEKIIAATKNEYAGDTESEKSSAAGIFEMLFIFGIFALQWLASVLGRSKAWWPGGLIGLGVGGALFLWHPFGFAVVAYLLIITGLTAFGAFFDYVVSHTYRHDTKHDYDHPWWIGGGHGSSFGSGFGGFGGGSFGGGGSSGSW